MAVLLVPLQPTPTARVLLLQLGMLLAATRAGGSGLLLLMTMQPAVAVSVGNLLLAHTVGAGSGGAGFRADT
jgi:hypothetical protein